MAEEEQEKDTKTEEDEETEGGPGRDAKTDKVKVTEKTEGERAEVKILEDLEREISKFKETQEGEESGSIEEQKQDAPPPEEDQVSEIEKLTSTLQYLQAEYENYKKRVTRDFESFIKFSNQALVARLLPILDDFEASLKTVGDEEAVEGFRIIYQKLRKMLKDEGLEEIRALGESFDPFRHEAVVEVHDLEKAEGEITDVVQKGYIFKSKVIRPSKVKVVKYPPKDEEAKMEDKKELEESEGGQQDG